MADFGVRATRASGSAKPQPHARYRVRIKDEVPLLLMIAAVVLGCVLLYPRLPDQIPLHWRLDGTVTRYAARGWLPVLLTPGLTLGVYLVLLLGPFRDPNRHEYGSFSAAYLVVRYVVTVFMCLLSAAVVLAGMGTDGALPPGLLSAGLSLLLMLLGPAVRRVGPNRMVGLRVPWTLRSEEVWRATHRAGGRLFVAAGAAGLAGAFLPRPWTWLTLLLALLAAVVVMAGYSWWLGTLERRGGTGAHEPPAGYTDKK